jgi:RNA polymerase sigma-70 factor, ECF subfamily
MATDPLHNPSQAQVRTQPEAQPCPSDSELMARIVLKDELAIAELYDRYSALVFSVARHVLFDESAAEDITQEIFLKLWRNPDSFDSARGSLRTWLTVVSRHRAIDRCRRRKVEINLADVVIPIDARQFGEVQLRQNVQRMADLFVEMPLHLRNTLQLAYFEGLTHTEISIRMGEPLGTVKSRIRLGLEWIRKRL